MEQKDLSSLIEIRLKDPNDFGIVRETLTRIGIASVNSNVLYQSCHILSRQAKTRYYLVHFKELFWLDGRPDTLTDNDIARRNTIANMLAQWGMIQLVDPSKSREPVVPLDSLTILSFKDRAKWTLQPKYVLGGKKMEDVDGNR